MACRQAAFLYSKPIAKPIRKSNPVQRIVVADEAAGVEAVK